MESDPKKTALKKMEITFVILVGLIVILFLIMWGWPKYQTWKFNRDLAALQAEEERPYLEDTYGGATPKETLELFITAVEKGDYDLASKYFILSKQEEWNKTLKKGGQENKLQELLKVTKEGVEEIKTREPLWLRMNKYNFSTENRVLFDFAKYPNGNWKIAEL